MKGQTYIRKLIHALAKSRVLGSSETSFKNYQTRHDSFHFLGTRNVYNSTDFGQ